MHTLQFVSKVFLKELVRGSVATWSGSARVCHLKWSFAVRGSLVVTDSSIEEHLKGVGVSLLSPPASLFAFGLGRKRMFGKVIQMALRHASFKMAASGVSCVVYSSRL